MGPLLPNNLYSRSVRQLRTKGSLSSKRCPLDLKDRDVIKCWHDLLTIDLHITWYFGSGKPLKSFYDWFLVADVG